MRTMMAFQGQTHLFEQPRAAGLALRAKTEQPQCRLLMAG